MNGLCKIDGCGRIEQLRRGLCNLHRMRLKSHGDPLIIKNRTRGTGSIRTDGYCMLEAGGRSVLRHVAIAEKALGKRLPKRAEVHHIDYNRGNDDPSNLVICPNPGYHQLLHIRTDAYNASGHWDWRKCHICKQYDDPVNLRFYKASGLIRHLPCWRKQYAQKKEAS